MRTFVAAKTRPILSLVAQRSQVFCRSEGLEMDGFGLKILRLRADLTQWRAAQAVGIAPQDLCHAERGRRPLPAEVTQQLIRLYERTIESESSRHEQVP
jgi:DNA-binding XRE family transcriptional regulator